MTETDSERRIVELERGIGFLLSELSELNAIMGAGDVDAEDTFTRYRAALRGPAASISKLSDEDRD